MSLGEAVLIPTAQRLGGHLTTLCWSSFNFAFICLCETFEDKRQDIDLQGLQVWRQLFACLFVLFC